MQQRNNPYEGLFITIEGGEGVGKTTLTQKLGEHLEKKGYQVLRTREPGGSPFSEQMRNFLLNPHIVIGERAELFLFLASRAEHLDKLILPALRAGKIVICERFNDSTIAYQGCARKLGMNYVEEVCRLAFSSFEPDRTLFLDIDPLEGLKRVRWSRGESFDRIEQEELQFHHEVRQGFLHLADKYPNRIAVLDAGREPDLVFDDAVKALDPYLLKPLKK
jgi:dTMP kinase